jgi:hypothetical protein
METVMAKKNAPKSLIENPTVSLDSDNVVGKPRDCGSMHTITIQIPMGAVSTKPVKGKEGVTYSRCGSVVFPKNFKFQVDGAWFTFGTTAKWWDDKAQCYKGLDSIYIKPYTEPKAREEKEGIEMPSMG